MKNMARKRKFVSLDITGKRFGQWVVLSRAESKKWGHAVVAYWNCKCDCGTERKVIGQSLRKGTSASCGCARLRVDAPLNHIISTYKKNAKKKEIIFNLTKEEVAHLIFSNCCYCGCPPQQDLSSQGTIKNRDSFRYNGIDRMNNSIGYIRENCMPCCGFCNRRKGSTQTQEEFLNWITRVYFNMVRAEANENANKYRDHFSYAFV
jgi:hypothetical protein